MDNNQTSKTITNNGKIINKKNVTLALIVIAILSIIGLSKLFSAASNTLDDAYEREQQKEVQRQNARREFNEKGEKLGEDIKNTLSQGDNIFTEYKLENLTTLMTLQLTVSDDWYHTEKFKQDRILEDASFTFNQLAIKNGMKTENDPDWPVRLVDIYGVEVSKKGWIW